MKFLNKNMLLALGFAFISTLSVQVSATMIELDVVDNIEVGNSIDLVISISDLGADDLSAFNIDLGFDDNLLNFTGYTLGTDLIDSFFGQEDFSFGQTSDGVVNIAELSWLIDFSLQPTAFVLATLSFDTLVAGIADFSILDIELVDGLMSPSNIDASLETARLSIVPSSSTTVPEPSSMLLFVLALVGFLVAARRKA